MRLDFASVAFLDVSRHFGRRRALRRVTMTVSAGTITALLGPNGAGKSTLLAIAATLLSPSSGSVRYGDHDGRAASGGLRASIGVLGHDLFLYPELSAAENLRFFARLYGVDEGAPVEQALGRADLITRADDPVGSFSRGMRQRLAVERALIHQPRLLLLDEPFTGLDNAAREGLRDRLRTVRAAGAIVLLTSHDTAAIAGLMDNTVSIAGGEVTA